LFLSKDVKARTPKNHPVCSGSSKTLVPTWWPWTPGGQRGYCSKLGSHESTQQCCFQVFQYSIFQIFPDASGMNKIKIHLKAVEFTEVVSGAFFAGCVHLLSV
jgi:hypothetical protein